MSVTSASASRVALGAIGRRLRLDQQARALSAISVWAVAGLFMAGCAFQARPLADDDGKDGGGDVMGCAWTVHFDACALRPFPTQALVLNGPTRWTFNTSTGSFGPMVPAGAFLTTQLSVNGGRNLLVLYSSAFTLEAGATLAVTGAQPLVIAADSMIEIDGDLDVGSHAGTMGSPATGPGANDVACLGNLDGGVGGGNGGGGGGALAASGGPGGANNNNGPGGSAGGQVSVPAFVRGGCAGGTGGTGGGNKNSGKGGNGGGAIELAARGGITVAGRITAGGGGGGGGGSQQGSSGGGGGGGSGGMISFQAPSVRLMPTAVIAANGGGGGAGGTDEDSGRSGDDGPLAATSARGGEPGSGRAGGDGGALTVASGGPGTGGSAGGGDGGGGGGGSVGYVMVRSGSFAATNAVVSPPASRL